MRPFTRRQAAENSGFLEMLRRTGNARLAARSIGRAIGTMQHRRTSHAELAQAWDSAAAAAHAAFHLAGGRRGPEAAGGAKAALDPPPKRALRTAGGEPVVVRTRSGRLQLRAAHPFKLTKTAEQVFLLALSATANIRLSAAAAGASPRAFYRRRQRDPAFAREWRLALKMGYDRLEAEALRSAAPESHADDEWRRQDAPAIPPMTADQAIQLLALHEKSVRQGWEMPHRRKRRDEPWETYTERLRAMWTREKEVAAEDESIRRALHFETRGDWRFEDEAAPLPLPPLELVTGWSRAKGGPKHNPDVALFGGWRIAEMERKSRGRA